MPHKRFRVLFTISEFMYSSQVRNICDLLSRLDRDVFDIEIGALRVGDEATADIAALGLPYFQFRLIPTRRMRGHDYRALLKSPFMLAYKRYNLVHSLLYQCVSSEPLCVKQLGRAKYVYTKSNLEWNNHPGEWHRKSQLSDRIISISEATSQLLKEQGFGDRTEKIYLGIDTDAFSVSIDKRHAIRQQLDIPERALVYGCVGQFIEVKDHITLIDAFERVADRYADAHLVICGPHHNDAYYHGCLARIRASRHASAIRVLGRVRDMPGLYSALDVFVLPSKFEAFGYAFVEAMSCQRPAIGCRAAGPLEIIQEGRTGYFCDVSDPVGLARQMSRYAADGGLLRAHGEAARNRIQELFSKDVMTRKYAELYLRLLRN